MNEKCEIQLKLKTKCPEPTKLYYKEQRKIVCLDDELGEQITRPLYDLSYYVNGEANAEPGEISNNDQKCKECFVDDMSLKKVKQLFNDHRRVDWIDVNEIWALNNFSLVNATLKYDEYDDRNAFYLVSKQQDGYKIHTFSFDPISLQRLTFLADPDNK